MLCTEKGAPKPVSGTQVPLPWPPCARTSPPWTRAGDGGTGCPGCSLARPWSGRYTRWTALGRHLEKKRIMFWSTIICYKAMLGRGQPVIITWILSETCPRCRNDCSICWPAAQRATTVLRLLPSMCIKNDWHYSNVFDLECLAHLTISLRRVHQIRQFKLHCHGENVRSGERRPLWLYWNNFNSKCNLKHIISTILNLVGLTNKRGRYDQI